MMRRLTEKVRRSIWVYPVLYSFLALMLAVIVILLDSKYLVDLTPYIPDIFLTSADLAKTVLTIIAGAFITIMTFTFSTTMVVLTMYTSQFSPRVIENFLSQKSTMKSFGIFVSGFLYSIISLLFIRDILSDYKIMAGTFGVIYILAGLVNFILYINSVGTYIQAGNLIDRLYHKAQEDIDAYRSEVEEYDFVDKAEVERIEPKISIRSPHNGYIQEVNYKRLFELSREHEIIMIFQKLTGQFVTDEDVVMEIYYDRNSDLYENLEKEIGDCVHIGERRTEAQDFSFSIQKIVEVALKALSPGINDPNTAIQCIRDLGLLLREAAQMRSGYLLMREDGDSLSALYREGYDLDILLRDTFRQIIHYGQGDVFVMLAVIKAHRHILEKAHEENREIIRGHLDHLMDLLRKSYQESLDMQLFDREYAEIMGRHGLRAKKS